jgi:hypothetical protein
MSDPVDILSANLDAISSDQTLTDVIMELVEDAVHQIRDLMHHGNDEARTAVISKFLPMAMKIMQETRDTKLEETKAECRQMIAEMLAP